MRALLRDVEDQALIALEVEEAVYDPEDQLLLLYAASGTIMRCQESCGPMPIP